MISNSEPNQTKSALPDDTMSNWYPPEWVQELVRKYGPPEKPAWYNST